MMYKLIECSKCGKLSIHVGERYYICPYCRHKGKINGGTLISSTEDFHALLDYMHSKQHEAGFDARFMKFTMA